MKTWGFILSLVLGASVLAAGLEQELYTASEKHIVQVNKLGDVDPEVRVDTEGATLRSLAVHEDKVYWSALGQDVIYRSDLDGAQTDVAVSGTGEVLGLEVDPNTGMLYWFDENGIYRAAPGGGAIETVVNSALIGAMALDADGGALYWMEGNAGTLKKAGLNGASVTDITPAGLSAEGVPGHFPCALAVGTECLYFYSASHHDQESRIYKTDTQGSYLSEVLAFADPLTFVASLSFNEEENMLYVCCFEGVLSPWPLVVRRYHLDQGYTEAVLSASEQQPDSLPFEDQVPVLGRRNFDIRQEDGQPALWFADGAGINRKALSEIAILSPVTLPVTDMEVVYENNASLGRIFWAESDPYAMAYGNLFCVDTQGGNRQTLADMVSFVFGIAVDAEAGYAYWASTLEQRIRRVSLSNGTISTVVSTPSWLGYPMGLALNKAENTLYCGFLQIGVGGAIGAYALDTGTFSLVAELEFSGVSIAVDSVSGRLYLSDSDSNVYRCNADGSEIMLLSGFEGGNMHVDSEQGRVYAARSGRLQQCALDGAELAVIGRLPAYHDVIAMHKFEYALTIVGPQEVQAGETVTLRIGTLPQLTGQITYAWYKDGIFLNGANTPEYSISAVTHEDAGEYQVQITDESKRLYLSEPFVLTVKDAMPAGAVLALGILILVVVLIGGRRLKELRIRN